MLRKLYLSADLCFTTDSSFFFLSFFAAWSPSSENATQPYPATALACYIFGTHQPILVIFVENKVVVLSTVCKYYLSPSHFVFETWYAAWLKRQNFGVHVCRGSAETLVRRAGITNHRLIAHSLSNISAKNSRNWLICVEVIVCYISVVCLRHSVVQWVSWHWPVRLV